MRGFLAGGSAGLFVGLLIGLSSSPVVGAVVAGIAAILSSILGLNPEILKMKSSGALSESRIAGFFLVGSLAMLVALYLRTHDALSPDPADYLKALESAGFDTRSARVIAADRLFAVTLSPDQESTGEADEDGAQETERTASGGQGGTVLFAGSTANCTRLQQVRSESVDRRLSELDHIGGDFGRLAKELRTISEPDKRVAALNVVEATLCE